MDRLVSLQKLNLNRNKLSDLDYLLLIGASKLKELEVTYNRLPVSYLDQLLVIIQEIQSLRIISFVGNEMALNKFYRVKLSSMYHISHLDSLPIKSYARRELG